MTAGNIVQNVLPEGTTPSTIVVNVPPGGQTEAHHSEIAADISAVLWPAVIIILAIVFRGPIGTFIGNLKSLEGAGIKVSVENQIETLLEDTPGPVDEEAKAALGVDIERPLAKEEMYGSIMLAWLQVEKQVRNLVQRPEIDKPIISDSPFVKLSGSRGYSSPLRNIDSLERRGIITSGLSNLIRELSQIRNTFAHDPEQVISRAALDKYISNAAEAVAALKNIEANLDLIT